ncbi:ABC transporter permease [Kroppenstedtia pulmonis]|uniref:ABC transporter permease n=1 Tax=Kroppenstedtia pulmonis TaxID=1380685 RepID=A0A7D4C6L5_9BACL|nr:ABC transporter permease [Kroppenstedtia pulmonis]QKG84496.1 ABC transporter permease [Kroppenstedtia pulmonis]
MLSMLKVNIEKQYIEFKRYWMNTLIEVVSLYIVLMGLFLGFTFIGGQAENFNEKIEYVVASYVIWVVAISAMQAIGYEVFSDLQRGTLDQIYMTHLPVWQIMLARMVGNVLIRMIGIIILLILSMVSTGVYLHIDLITILPIFTITLISMFGIGFIVAGLCLVLKQVSNLLFISQFIVMTVVYIPLESAPYLKFFPFTLGVDMLKQSLLYEVNLLHFSVMDYTYLFLNSAVYFLLGIWIFLRCEHRALSKGILGKY